MDEALRQFIRERASHRCEYCHLPQDAEPFFAYHVEHIVARQHGGGNDSGNLAFACYHCNSHKGPNLSGLDPESGALVGCFTRARTNGMRTLSATESSSSDAPR